MWGLRKPWLKETNRNVSTEMCPLLKEENTKETQRQEVFAFTNSDEGSSEQ